ncbi:MAG: hypothetical protein KDD33_04490 [Bdellovibrionales bacterium]|nr:hypothetical protein [Bdellovibrionales bacterium]
MKFIISALTTFLLQPALADFSSLSINDAAVITLLADGSYQVNCKDGSIESASDLDIKLDNICPKLTSVPAYDILSVQKREDGMFDVVCKDLSKHIASQEDLMAGKVCSEHPPQFSLQEGIYLPLSTDSYFCDDYQVSEVESNASGEVVSFNYHCTTDSPWPFTCQQGQCNEKGGSRSIQLTEGIDDQFEYQTGGLTSKMVRK